MPKIDEVIKGSARMSQEEMIQALGEYVVSHLQPKKFIKDISYTNIFKGKIKEDAILQLSDMHVGKINKILDPISRREEVTFNHEILVKECARLVESIYTINNILSPTYDIDTLWILSEGDIIENHMIFAGQQFYIDADAGKQVWVAVQLCVDIINSLLKSFKKINWVGVIGNHGRITPKAEETPVSSSFDYQILRILQVIFKNDKRVTVTVPETWDYLVDIKGWKYYMHHGDNVYSISGTPYAGIIKQGKARSLEFDYDMELIGHFHQKMEIPMSSKAYTMVNGGWIYHDSYAWKKMGILSIPSQNYFGVSEKRPRTWKFDLDLNTKDHPI